MSDHIFNVAFHLDDDYINDYIRQDVKNDLLKELANRAEKRLPKKYYDKTVDWGRVAEEAIRKFFDDHAAEIVETAAENVAASIKKSKRYREAVARAAGEVEACSAE